MSHAIERIWASDGPLAWALAPLSWLYGAATRGRNALFDLGVLRAHSLGLPTISIGNVSVGGTGKTPVSAWVASELAKRGAKPAILLRGYGDDEPLVHERLNPGLDVIAGASRIQSAVTARARGATAIVLDDAFQHRRAKRDVDWVLVAAEQDGPRRVLPAGPLREAASGVRRASLIVVTRKSASLADAEAAAARWSAFAGAPPTAVLYLRPGDLLPASGRGVGEARSGGAAGPDGGTVSHLAIGAVRGKSVLAISAVGAPRAFAAQLEAAGASVTPLSFADHHGFSEREITELALRAERVDIACCTLKDAVKLGPRWPRQAPPLWYLSQAVEVERGADEIDAAFRRLVAPTAPQN